MILVETRWWSAVNVDSSFAGFKAFEFNEIQAVETEIERIKKENTKLRDRNKTLEADIKDKKEKFEVLQEAVNADKWANMSREIPEIKMPLVPLWFSEIDPKSYTFFETLLTGEKNLGEGGEFWFPFLYD